MGAGLLQRWRAHREAAAVARKPIPEALWKRNLVRYPFLRRRDPTDEAELRRLTSLFLDRKEFNAAPGVRLSDDVVVAIASQACLPVLRLGLAAYDDFVGIVLHPDQVVARRAVTDDDGVVHEYDEVLSGEAVRGGPVMLSWRDVRTAGRSAADAYNVVIHEFAHVLDMANGEADAMPPLPAAIGRAEWQRVIETDYAAFTERVDAGHDTALDPYGAEAIDEFFAVASEAFFVAPRAMKKEHPALYGVFVRYYRQDPAAEGFF
ncbi:MAG: zinc-dependent peptidase [Burkholderiales bacterium]|nr:zinc-dependent peptidase [Burkholderiales bacterium]MDE2395964.1 zinc-dependent peptidase [Burkholderiales bacterium]MDE2452429.1 zinc-dependent peptidase [Burkholderiales bacterium]